MYPSILQAFNICRETKTDTVLGIEGHPVEAINHYFGHMVSPRENAVMLANTYYNLGNYEEVLAAFDAS